MEDDETIFSKEEAEWLKSLGGRLLKDGDEWCFVIKHDRIRLVVQKIPCPNSPYMVSVDDHITKLEFIDTGQSLKALVIKMLRKYTAESGYIAKASCDAKRLLRKARRIKQAK